MRGIHHTRHLSFVLIHVGLLLHAGVDIAFLRIEVDWRLVPQQGAAIALLLFEFRILLFQRLDELGVIGFVELELFAEFHGLFDNGVSSGVILPCLVLESALNCGFRVL